MKDDNQKRLTDILKQYKKHKDCTHYTVSHCVENTEVSNRILKQKNEIMQEIYQELPSDEAFAKCEQAYKDAGLHNKE